VSNFQGRVGGLRSRPFPVSVAGKGIQKEGERLRYARGGAGGVCYKKGGGRGGGSKGGRGVKVGGKTKE